MSPCGPHGCGLKSKSTIEYIQARIRIAPIIISIIVTRAISPNDRSSVNLLLLLSPGLKFQMIASQSLRPLAGRAYAFISNSSLLFKEFGISYIAL